jgi:hypothetical protein
MEEEGEEEEAGTRNLFLLTEDVYHRALECILHLCLSHSLPLSLILTSCCCCTPPVINRSAQTKTG